MRYEWADMSGDGVGALVGVYILECEGESRPRLHYRYTDGTSFPSDPAKAEWMPEMLRLAERERDLLRQWTENRAEIRDALGLPIEHCDSVAIVAGAESLVERERKLREVLKDLLNAIGYRDTEVFINWNSLPDAVRGARALLKEE